MLLGLKAIADLDMATALVTEKPNEIISLRRRHSRAVVATGSRGWKCLSMCHCVTSILSGRKVEKKKFISYIT